MLRLIISVGLNILFNNAGIGGAVGPITHINADEWDKSFQMLLKSVFLGCKYAARVMIKKLGYEKFYFRMGRDTRMFIIFLGAMVNQPLFTLALIALITNMENIRRVFVLYKNG